MKKNLLRLSRMKLIFCQMLVKKRVKRYVWNKLRHDCDGKKCKNEIEEMEKGIVLCN